MSETEAGRIERERDFWDHAIPFPDEAIKKYEDGPDPNTSLMLDSIQIEPGMKVLDFACGAGFTSAWLADRGAEVTAIDLSPESIAVARKVGEHAGVKIDFQVADVEQLALPDGGFDAIVGRYALHHLDTERMAPVLASCVKPGGRGAFVETFDLNPVLRFARNNVIGRAGVPRYGTLDEHPLTRIDIDLYRQAFGSLTVHVAEYRFLFMLDRQILHYRWPRVSRALSRADEAIRKSGRLPHWSFHQVVVVERLG